MASGAAVALLRAGYQVILAEVDNPISVRRLVCFSEAVYEGVASVAGWRGILAAAATARFLGGEAVVLVDPTAGQLVRLRPDLVVDARMTKRQALPLPGVSCPVIGLGPGFTCGQDAALVVETVRGPDLGRVVFDGAAAPYSGRPGLVGGRTVTRVLRAPVAGSLAPLVAIGDLVAAGQSVGTVAGQPVKAAIAGLVRGLVHSRAELPAGGKVGDVDPRGEAVDPAALTDKACRVGAGVLRAVQVLRG